MGLFEMDSDKKYCLGSVVVPQTPIPLHTMGQKSCFWRLGMGCIPKGQCLKVSSGSAGAPQTPIPLHTMGQKSCFWIPGMGVFEMGKNIGGFSGGAPTTHSSAHYGPEKVLPGMGVFEMDNA